MGLLNFYIQLYRMEQENVSLIISFIPQRVKNNYYLDTFLV